MDPGRIARWVAGFADRHGPSISTSQEFGLLVTAADGATAEVHAPPGVSGAADLDGFLAAVSRPRRIGLLLARKGAVALGVAEGAELVVSKVDTHYVQGRTAAGGWSQQRFARRRENQAKAAVADAAELAVRLLLPAAPTLAALVCGGDRRTVDAVLTDRRLAPLVGLRAERLLTVPEPRRAVLLDAIPAARAVRILVRDPEVGAARTAGSAT